MKAAASHQQSTHLLLTAEQTDWTRTSTVCMRYNRKWARRDPLKGAPEEIDRVEGAGHTGFTEDSAVWAGPTCRRLWVLKI